MVASDSLYQELILDHYRRPRNRRRLEGANRVAEGFNPLCGDQVRVFLSLDGNVLKDVAFEGHGCAISTASASIMTETLKGKTLENAEELFQRFHKLLTGNGANGHGSNRAGCNGEGASSRELGKLRVFSGVSKYPARVKCATLAWHTLDAALKGADAVVSTE